MTLCVLKETKIGVVVNSIKKKFTVTSDVGQLANEVIKKWKTIAKVIVQWTLSFPFYCSIYQEAYKIQVDPVPVQLREGTVTAISRIIVNGTVEAIPLKNSKGEFTFSDHPEFRPNLSPKEVLQLGSFGGTYFRPIKSGVTNESYAGVWKELPSDWLDGLDIKTQIASPTYRNNVNKYKIDCGGDLHMWESSGWITDVDPYGWFQWYCRFFQGRRTSDDARYDKGCNNHCLWLGENFVLYYSISPTRQ